MAPSYIFCLGPVSQYALSDAVSAVQTCVMNIEYWVTTILLQLNTDKTEILLIDSEKSR